MILRKPYAFLIKKFKLIHLILSILMFYLVYRFNTVYTFFKEYVNKDIHNRILASDYITLFMFLVILFITIGLIIVYLLMRFKKKPKTLYLINIIGYFASFIILWYSLSVLKKLEYTVLDTRVVRLTKDFVLVATAFQGIMSIIMFVRALGFDIKKFNFEKDISELNIDVTDNEEFELVVGIDTNKVARKTRRKWREFKYFILENKFIVFIACIILISIISFSVFLNRTIINKVYKEKDKIATALYTISIEDSYYTTKKYDGTVIKSKDKAYLLIKLNIQGRYDNLTLNRNNIRLIIDGNKHYPNLKYYEYFKDIGIGYTKQTINQNNSNYLLVYEINREDVGKKMMITFVDSIKYTSVGIETKYKNISLKPTSLDTIIEAGSAKLGEELILKDTVIGNMKFKINNYDIALDMPYVYKVCTQNVCNDIYSKITPTKNYPSLGIMSLNISFDKNNPFNFMSTYGSLHYIINDTKKKYNMKFVNITPSNYEGDNIFIEVYDEVINASSIWFEFNIRDKKYKYILK